MKRRLAFMLLLSFSCWCCLAGEPGVDGLRDVFDPARAQPPKPGDWLEFRVAFRADPLEHSLMPERGEVAPTGRRTIRLEDEAGEYVFFVPHFEPERVWRVAPLRLEVREVEADGCNVVLTFGGRSHTFFMAKGAARETDWYYDPDLGGEELRAVTVGDDRYDVEEVRRDGERYGFVRWFSDAVPFGIVRFATPDVDIALVGTGRGRAPSFPLDVRDMTEPPLGLLFYPVANAGEGEAVP